MNQVIEAKNSALFEALVPASGMADTKGGELVRAVNRIGYRFYNDGDHIGVGYGNETCNSAARYILKEFDGTEMAEIVKGIWGIRSERLYEKGIDALTEAMVNFLEDHPEFTKKENQCDMHEFGEPEDDEWEDEDDEEEYSAFVEPWAVYDPD